MPPPGFPDWLGPGAIVRERPNQEQPETWNDNRFIVMDVELQLPETTWDGSGEHPSIYAIALMTLNYDEQEVDRATLHTLNLSAFLDLYEWTGEYFTPEGSIVSQGTTMPVTMYTAALRPAERIVIQGSPEHDGEFIIESITHHTGARNGFSLEAVTADSFDWARPGLAQEQAEDMANLVSQMEEAGIDAHAVVTHDPPLATPPQLLNETDVPVVAADQIWLLPRPNQGLWRTSFNPTDRGNIRLTHERERDRVMNCPATWLVQHGVRQTPPDPRTGGQQAIVIGQVWEFKPEAGSRYRRFPRWRVCEVNAAADMIMLMDEGGSGKRIYLPPARILSLATFVGDGLPRRTAYEHILEADD